MLIELWLDQPVPIIFACLAAWFGLAGLAIWWLTFGQLTHAHAGRLAGVVAPFFGSVSILFGLLTGFVANDAWERNRQASRAILAERDGLVAVHDLSIATVSDMAAIRAAVRAYLHTVISDEWPRLPHGESSPKVGPALATLLSELSDPKITQEAGQVAHAALLELTLKVRTARSDRLALSEQYSDHPKWWTVLLLGLLTQVSLGLVHLDKPRAQAAALTVFSAAAIVALGLVAIRERPFDGPLGLKPSALEAALAAMPIPTQPPEPVKAPDERRPER